MSESNGISAVDGAISEGTGGPVELVSTEKDVDKEKFPPDRKSNGNFRIPQVCLTRHDFSLYLNNARKACKPRLNGILKRTSPKSISDEEAHKKRLSLKCTVNLFRDDLDKLKASGSKALNRWKTSADPDSDSSCSDSNSNMVSKCKICNKSYNSDKKLLNHQKEKHIIYVNSKPIKRVSFSDHIIIYPVCEYHKCRKCPKLFKNYRSLKLHTKQQHKKRKCYICNYCKKSFAERLIFKVHIKLHCEVCGEHFPTKSKCIEHKRNTCRVLKLYKCKTCKGSFYNIMHLKDHGYDHSDACHVCDICKDQFESKCLIAHHISFLHEKNRPKSLYTMRKIGNERLYLCNFCEESSVERETMARHINKLPDLRNRAMTGYKDYFFCDVCFRKFSSEQETMQHKWTHFLTTQLDKPNGILKSMLETDKGSGPMKQAEAKMGTQVNVVSASNSEDFVKKYFNIHNPLPHNFQPKVMLQHLNLKNTVITKLNRQETPGKNMSFGETPKIYQNFVETPSIHLASGEIPGMNTNSRKSITNQLYEEAPSIDLTSDEIPEIHQNIREIPQDFGEISRSNQIYGETPRIDPSIGETPRASMNLDDCCSTPSPAFIDIEIDIDPQVLKKPIVDIRSKKTLLSKHQCQTCGKYFSNNYCLNRHIASLHGDSEALRCGVCEETFVWPSLLRSHKCIRLHRPEMPFDDARPEIQLENQETRFDDLNIAESDDYMNSVDFEVPAPMAEGVGYKLVMHEVPIEF